MFLECKKYGNEDKLHELVEIFKLEFGKLNNTTISNFRSYYKNDISVYSADGNRYDIDFLDSGDDPIPTDWWGLKLFDREDINRIDPYTQNKFHNTIKFLSTLPNLVRAQYTSVGPSYFVPAHVDTEEGHAHETTEVVNFTITIHAKGNITFRSGNETVIPTPGDFYCIDAFHEEHEANNNSNDHWAILILQIERSCFL